LVVAPAAISRLARERVLAVAEAVLTLPDRIAPCAVEASAVLLALPVRPMAATPVGVVAIIKANNYRRAHVSPG
jgi:hypothetical protein